VRIESLDWMAIEHATLRVSAAEITEMFEDEPVSDATSVTELRTTTRSATRQQARRSE